MKRLGLLIFISLVVLIDSSTAVGRAPASQPTGARPGAAWTRLASVSAFRSEGRTFSWLVGKATPSGCRYHGVIDLTRGRHPRALMGIWVQQSTCTMEVMRGTPTAAFLANLAQSAGGSVNPQAQAPGSGQRAAWDHQYVLQFWAHDWLRYLVGIRSETYWNGVWSSPCYDYDTVHYADPAWGAAWRTDGGNCWVGYPSWDPGNRYVINEASADWNSNVYNGQGRCSSHGATARWWFKIWARGDYPNHESIAWTFTPGGNCGGYMSPILV